MIIPSLGVVVEVDDDSHNEPEKRRQDAERTAVLEALGWRVLRCTNDEALFDPLAVQSSILDYVRLHGAVDMTKSITGRPRPGRRRKLAKKRKGKTKATK